jgi:hypothetical protein
VSLLHKKHELSINNEMLQSQTVRAAVLTLLLHIASCAGRTL